MKIRISILILILTFVFGFNCKNKINSKIINNENYIKISKHYYYKIDAKMVNDYYYGKNSKLSWTRFNYLIEDFGYINVYISINHDSLITLNNVQNKFINDIQNSNDILKDYTNFNNLEFKEFKNVSFIKHNEKTNDFYKDENNNIKWKTKGGNTDIVIYFTDKNDVYYYNITFIYRPTAHTAEDANDLYEKNKEKIMNIINQIYYFENIISF